jgi:hypothetical protein
MGLFSGGFGTGLATGLAESVDQSLKTAMDKREKELSRARTFWETRQAQKMDLADAHDERAGDALDKLIKEFKGDVAKGLAAYQAVGGNVDDVESYLASVKDTRDKLGEYNIADKLKLDGIDLSQFGDLSRDRAFQSIRKDVSGIDVQMQDTGLLGKIGFGKDLGADVSASVNELMPARQYEDITEFAAATMDRSGLVGTEEYARQVARETLQGQDRYFYNIGRIQSGELSVEESDKLKDENAAILLATELFEKAKDTTGGDFTTLTELTSQFKNWRTEQENQIGYVAGKPGQAAIVQNPIMPDGSRGDQLTGADAVAYRNKYIGEEQVDWVRNNLLDDKGQARSVDAQAMITGYDFRSIVKGIQSDIASAGEAEAGTETPTVEGSIVDPNYDPESEDNEAAQAAAAAGVAEKPLAEQTLDEAGFDNAAAVVANPQGFADYIVAANPNVSIDALAGQMQAAGVPVDSIIQILTPLREQMAERQAANAAEAAKLDAFLNPPVPKRQSQPIVSADVEEGDFGSGA